LSYGVTGSRATKSITLPFKATSYVLKGLEPSQRYDVSLRATSKVGAGPVITSTSDVPELVPTDQDAQLSSATMSALLSTRSDAAGLGRLFVWPPGTAGLAGVGPGMVIEGPASALAPEGIEAMVQTVSTSAAGDVVVDTTPADASDALLDGSFSYAGEPYAATSPKGSSVVGAARVGAPSSNGDPCWSPGYPFTPASGVCLTPYESAGGYIQCHWWITIWHWQICTQTDVGGNVSDKVTGTQSLVAQTSGTLSTLPAAFPTYCASTTWGCMTTGIQVTYQLTGSVNIDSTTSGYLSGTQSYDGDTLTLHGNGSAALTTTSNLVLGSGTGSVNMQAVESGCISNKICVSLTLNGTQTEAFRSSGQPWFSLCPSTSASGSFQLPANTNGANYVSQTIATPGSNVCATTLTRPVTLSIQPSAPTVAVGSNVQTFGASRDDNQNPQSTWSLFGEANCDTVNSSGTLTTCYPTYGTPFVLRDSDATLPRPTNNPASTPVAVDSDCELSPPQSLAVTVTSTVTTGWIPPIVRPRAGYFSWSAPTSAGGTWPACGATISGYLWSIWFPASTAPQTYWTTTDQTPSIDLMSFGSYQVTVVAVNSDGDASDPASIYFYRAWS